MVQCDVTKGLRRCEQAAVAELTHGCIHEHMETTPICASCLLEVRVLFGLRYVECQPCHVGASPHDCETFEVRERRYEAA